MDEEKILGQIRSFKMEMMKKNLHLALFGSGLKDYLKFKILEINLQKGFRIMKVLIQVPLKAFSPLLSGSTMLPMN